MPSSPTTTTATTSTTATRSTGDTSMLQKARPASNVSGDVLTLPRMSATDQAMTTRAMPLATHQLMRRPEATMATPTARAAIRAPVAAQ